jgi:hypothetical protein
MDTTSYQDSINFLTSILNDQMIDHFILKRDLNENGHLAIFHSNSREKIQYLLYHKICPSTILWIENRISFEFRGMMINFISCRNTEMKRFYHLINSLLGIALKKMMKSYHIIFNSNGLQFKNGTIVSMDPFMICSFLGLDFYQLAEIRTIPIFCNALKKSFLYDPRAFMYYSKYECKTLLNHESYLEMLHHLEIKPVKICKRFYIRNGYEDVLNFFEK